MHISCLNEYTYENKCKKITLGIEGDSNILYYIFEGGVNNAYENVFD